MNCKAIQIQRPHKFSFGDVDIGSPTSTESIVEIHYSSMCGTDYQIYTGNLTYYKTGMARYPIITGHEWCGIHDKQPVVGLCILGCENCNACNNSHSIWCQNRQEVGVVNKNGAHAQCMIMPTEKLIPIPEISPKYALVEPLAVAIHGLKRINFQNKKILISGFGSIGKLCGTTLDNWGYSYDIYDPLYDTKHREADVIIECSGNSNSLPYYLNQRGIEILLFGFEYQSLSPGLLVSNEINLITSLGADTHDFNDAVEIMFKENFDFFKVVPFKKFNGYQYSTKTIFNNRDI